MQEQFLDAGNIVGTHGVRGEVKLVPLCDGAEFLKGLKVLYIDGRALPVEGIRSHKGAALIKFEGIDTVEAGMALRGKLVRFDRSDVKLPRGRVFLSDVYGLPVYDTRTEREIGTLAEILFLPAGEVWVVRGDAGEIMIPQKGGFIDPVDPAEGKITVHTIEGMLPDEN